MANIVSDVMKMATPAIIEKIAASFGLTGTAVSSILASAVPALMGAVANRSASASGAKDVLSVLAGANPNLASGMVSALTGASAGNLATGGTSMLTSLLGQGGLSTFTNAVLGNTGVSPAAGGSIMGIAGQMVMGALAKESSGLDASGLMKLMASQKGFIQAALPAGVAGLVHMAGSTAANATSTVSNATASVNNAVPTPAMPNTSGGMGWLKYALPVAALAVAAWYFMTPHGAMDNTATMAKPAATETAPAAPAAMTNIMIDNIDVTKNLTGAFTDLTGSLGGITDVATATAALPKMQTAATAITAVSGLAAKFSPGQKTAVASLVNGGLPALTAAATKVQGIAGVSDLVKPVLDGLLANLANLAK